MPDPGKSSPILTLKLVGHQSTTSILCLNLMTEENGGKTLPDPGNSSIYKIEACRAPVERLDTFLPNFGDRKKGNGGKKLCRILGTAAVVTLKPLGHQFTSWIPSLPRFDDRKNGGKTLPDPGNSRFTHLETRGTPVDELDALLSFDDGN